MRRRSKLSGMMNPVGDDNKLFDEIRNLQMHFVNGKSDSEIDVNSLVERLHDTFPGITIVADDYYAERLKRARAIALELGLADDCAPIRCTERVAMIHETQLHLLLPISPGMTLDTRVDKTGILAVGGEDTLECKTEVKRLIDILTTFRVNIETSWDEVK